MASRRCGANRGTGRSGTSSESGGNAGNGNVRRAAAGLKRGLPAEAPAKARSRPTNATVLRRKASVRFAVQAQRTRRASPARLTRAARRDKDKKMRLSALRPPLDSGSAQEKRRSSTREGAAEKEKYCRMR